jgi:hypothetical protein
MMGLRGEGITGEDELFQKPIFQTFGMFVGMTFGLVMHCVVLFFKIPFPGYPGYGQGGTKSAALNSEKGTTYGTLDDEKKGLLDKGENGAATGEPQSLPVWMYFFLAIPALFDLGATALCMMGLQYIDVSIYQLLRGSGECISG